MPILRSRRALSELRGRLKREATRAQSKGVNSA
jgi:hypothetical protein